jgi:hypothetical protein
MMLFSSLVAAVGFLAAGSQARYVKRDDGLTIFSRKAVAKRAPSETIATTAVLPLTKMAATGASAARRQRLSKLLIANGSTTTLTSLFTGEEFAAEVEFGTQTFEMIVDTGSSDTWVVEAGFVCTDLDTGKTTTEGIELQRRKSPGTTTITQQSLILRTQLTAASVYIIPNQAPSRRFLVKLSPLNMGMASILLESWEPRKSLPRGLQSIKR